MSLVSRTALTVLAGLVAVPMTPMTRTSPSPGAHPVSKAAPVAYTSSHKEFYLAADQLAFVRPGIVYKINSVTIAGDRKPVVDVTITDTLGAPVDRLGIQTPGPVSASFLLAWYNPVTRDYTSYNTRIQTAAPPSAFVGNTAVQAANLSGTIVDLELGHFRFNSSTVLPAGFDQTMTHTMAVYGRRTMPADILDGKEYIDNTELDFRPDGQAVTVKWDEIQERNSCNQCHDPISAHGDVRQDLKLCVMCHSPQTTDPDTGNSVDMRIMVHKIHRGPNLPSVKAGTPYQIIGNSQNVHDYGEVTFPQDIRNCANCHEGRDPANKPSQSNVWYTFPARNPCGACHDDINWATGANHAGGAQADDSQCASCHVPQGDAEWDAGIKTAHTVPYRSTQLKGLNATIVAVDNVGPGLKPVVTFKLTNGDGSVIPPANFNATNFPGSSLNILLGGPALDYGAGATPPAQPFRENAVGAAFNGTNGVYTFTNAIPATATGTWAVAIEARRPVTFSPAPSEGPATFTEGAVNPVKYIAVTGGTAVPRRQVVTLTKCNNCHDRLATTFSHGGQRIAIEECDICHNGNATDVNRRYPPPATNDGSKGQPESIAFKRMAHRIHTGNLLTQNYIIYGNAGTPNSFNEVTYPGDRMDCLQCHASASTFDLPLPVGTIPTITPSDYFSPQGAGTSACLGCHDNVDAAAHAYLNTVTTPFFGEACASCHGAGRDWDVARMHAR
jgi:OmcA/MtrC family decaheme c-type cytochrome